MGYKNHDKGNTFPSSPNHGRSVYNYGRGVKFCLKVGLSYWALTPHKIKQIVSTLCLEVSLKKIFWLGG